MNNIIPYIHVLTIQNQKGATDTALKSFKPEIRLRAQ